LAGARLATAQRLTALLEKSHAFNSLIITFCKSQVQRGVQPQLEARVSTALQRAALPDAGEQTKLIINCARELFDSVCPLHRQRSMHVVSGQG
jgi:hypothetical protein